MNDDNFGYTLPPSKSLNENVLESLLETVRKSKRYTFFSFLEAVAIPYVAEKCDDMFPESWNNVTYNGMLMMELLAVSVCLYSAYGWWKTSKQVSELEKIIGVRER